MLAFESPSPIARKLRTAPSKSCREPSAFGDKGSSMRRRDRGTAPLYPIQGLPPSGHPGGFCKMLQRPSVRRARNPGRTGLRTFQVRVRGSAAPLTETQRGEAQCLDGVSSSVSRATVRCQSLDSTAIRAVCPNTIVLAKARLTVRLALGQDRPCSPHQPRQHHRRSTSYQVTTDHDGRLFHDQYFPAIAR